MSGLAMPKPDAGTMHRRAEIVADMRIIVPGEGVVDTANEMRAFETDGLTAYRQLPLVVVLPETVAQVSRVLKYCDERNIRVVPRGSGTSLSGGALPLEDAVLLVMSRFNRIVAIDYPNRVVVAQPGVTNLGITIAVEQEGLRLPPVKLFKKGVLDPEIYAIICSNIRVADQRIGDIRAQAAALLIGQDRLSEILDRYGDETVVEAIAELRRRAADQMRASIAVIPDGVYRSQAFVDSDGVVNEPLTINLAVEKKGDTLTFDFAGSSKPCAGPMNSVLATTLSSVYLAMRHIFPEVPISAGAFEPLNVKRPEGTFLDAKYPRPVSGCAAEVSQRIAEAVFAAMVQALPEKVTAAPAGSSGNFALGGNDPARGRDYVMYQISGGGYGGNAGHDGLSNGCSTIGISKSPPVEIMEQAFPVLYRHYALREGSGGAGKHRGGFGLAYEVEILRGEARASFVMDHGRFGPQGALGGRDGAPNSVTVFRGGEAHVPPHLSKEQDIALKAGDRVRVGTPGGGGYGDPSERDPRLIAEDVRLGYYTPEQAREMFGSAPAE
ncbi:hydantoinase B/oxoprolinase family protein [Mesorhizobium sp. M1E.F.Ca.ET.063.01.1.1]|uniref:hydantoinase B/oxoprolinase family protein n=1 Tax=Mesorhizobium sp. M1E.F.Ca.ET.063.01.1.1 TaxID=2496750 RepID=UPI00167B5AAA|nr:hydantoinase B/oxoprolinase family protein [Mesorhizobium sp. M1E.F.Ca.ET.063.01.1.1]